MSFNCDDIKNLAVKVSYAIGENQSRESSGVIVRPTKETDYFFVLTAKHALKDNDEQTYNDVDTHTIETSKISLKYDSNHELKPIKIIDTKHDLVVLVIENTLCKDKNLVRTKILDGIYRNCGLVGYPEIANHELECFDKCTYSIGTDDVVFKINTNESLQSTHQDEIETTRGYSGSGLFTQLNSDYLLTGVISEVIPYKSSFKCVNLSSLLKDISLEEYGGIEIVSLEKLSNTEDSLSQSKSHINIEIDKLQTVVQEQVTKELEELKTNFLNGMAIDAKEWIDAIKNSPKWDALTSPQQVEILYEEAKVLIENSELNEANRIVKQIKTLDSSKYINRLLSWIELKNNNSEKAIDLLDNDEVATLNQKASIYISMRRYPEAKVVIDSIPIDNRNHETYRVKAIYDLYNNEDIDIALKSINKSLELNPNYLESKRVKAIVLFYSATQHTVIPDLVPPITQNGMLKIDKKSQESIEESKRLFLEIDKISPEYRDKSWVGTILWLLDKKEAIQYLQRIYEYDEYKNITIQFTIVYGLDIDIESDIKEIESKQTLDFYEADTLIRYFLAKDDKERIFALLEEYKYLYETNNAEESWKEYYINSLLKYEMYEDIFKFLEDNKINNDDELKAHIFRLTNDFARSYELYEKLYSETNSPHYRLVICEMKAEENNWEYITEYSDYLIENFQTEKVVELVVYAEYNTNNFSKAKDLINQWIDYIKNEFIIDNFKRIQAMCESALGFPERSIKIYEENNFMETHEDISNLTYLYQKTNSQAKLETLATKVIKNPKVNVDSKIQMASMSKNSSLLLNEVMNMDDVGKSGKELALALYKQGIMNDLVIPYLPQLIEDKSIIGSTINLNEFPELMSQINEQREHEYTLYQNSNISMHHLDKDFFNGYNKENQKTLYIRSAKKYEFIKIKEPQNTVIYLDITSLLLLFSLDKLQFIINSFSQIFLPSNIFFILDDINASDTLKDLIKINFELEKLYFSPEVNRNNLKDEKEPSNLLLSIYTLLDFNKENALICVDDRYVNSCNQTQNKQIIISTNDILFALYQKNILSEDEYYDLLLKMRKRKYLYILITTEEIIYHLTKCPIVNKKIIESEDLKVLRNYLQFLVQHFKYIKPFTHEEAQNSQYAEAFFVINQQREIQDSIIELWNEVFEYNEDRYIYLNWIMENIFVFDMSYLIKNKLPHSDDVSMTMSLIGISSSLIQAITISKNGNQKLYFDWFYNNYLNRFFIVNPKLFENCLDHIKEIVVKTFIKEDSKDIEKAMVQNLIMNFPDKIKNALGSVKQIQNEFLMGRVIGLGELKFIDRVLIEKVTKVINGDKKAVIHTLDEPAKTITVVSKIIQNKKEIEIIYENGDKGTLDRRFFILSTSAKKRRELLYEHPEWLDMSNERKEQVVKKLNSIKIHYDRFEALHGLIEKSSFYKNLEDNLKEGKITFQDLCPEDINTLLDYFRLDVVLPTEEIFNFSIETLLDEENIHKTINIVQNFPIEFSDKIIHHLKSISFDEQKKILLQILKTSRSPIGIIHLLNVLIALNNTKFNLIIRYLIKQIFTNEFKLELEAFISVLNYVKQEFNRRYIHLNNDIKLALIWAHTNKLIRYFNAYAVDSNWINENFKQQTNMITLEIFRPDSLYNRDILNDSFSYERFIVASLCYAYENNFNRSQGEYTVNKINKLVDFDKNSFAFIRLNVKVENAVNSFLEIKDSTVVSNFIKIEESLKIIDKFILTPQDNNILLNILSLKYDIEKLNNEEEKRLIEYIGSYDLGTSKPTEIEFHNVLFMIKQLNNISNESIAKKVIELIFKLSESIETEKEAGLLIELLIYLSIYRVEKVESRIKLFVKYISNCEKLHKYDITKHMINKFLNELPLKYSNYFLLLKYTINTTG